MALEHELGVPSAGIPELDAPILRTGENPLSVRGKSNTENKILEKTLVFHSLKIN